MNGLNNVICFTIGAALGSVVTWKLIKNKYEKITKEEIESVKEVYAKRHDESISKEFANCGEDVTKGIDDAINESKQIISESGYSAEHKEGEQMTMYIDDESVPYVIPPEEFGEMDYDTVSYTYYADKVLTDDYDVPVEDIDGTIGAGSLETFGEFEDDSVFVRNDALKIDFEILLDLRNYADIHPDDTKPYKED